jgi:hypothetical protein
MPHGFILALEAQNVWHIGQKVFSYKSIKRRKAIIYDSIPV